jgi:hypothetical protein
MTPLAFGASQRRFPNLSTASHRSRSCQILASIHGRRRFRKNWEKQRNRSLRLWAIADDPSWCQRTGPSRPADQGLSDFKHNMGTAWRNIVGTGLRLRPPCRDTSLPCRDTAFEITPKARGGAPLSRYLPRRSCPKTSDAMAALTGEWIVGNICSGVARPVCLRSHNTLIRQGLPLTLAARSLRLRRRRRNKDEIQHQLHSSALRYQNRYYHRETCSIQLMGHAKKRKLQLMGDMGLRPH